MQLSAPSPAEQARYGGTIKPKGASKSGTHVRPTLQIDSAGGHGIARGHGNFTVLKAIILKDIKIELERQPGATPFRNVLDLTIWQASQLEVDKMNGEARHREPGMVKMFKKALAATPDVKILQAFKMRRDSAAEALENEVWCPKEGKARGGAKRVHTDAPYAELRAYLGILNY